LEKISSNTTGLSLMEYTSLSQYNELSFEFSLEEIVVFNGAFWWKRYRKRK